MTRLRITGVAFLCAAALQAATARADDYSDPGRRIFERRCQTCHGGTGKADAPIGPDLAGVFGRKVGSGDSGVHSRAAIESETVWTRSSLRRFLSEPGKEMPGTLMPVRVQEPKDLDDLLNFLQTMR